MEKNKRTGKFEVFNRIIFNPAVLLLNCGIMLSCWAYMGYTWNKYFQYRSKEVVPKADTCIYAPRSFDLEEIVQDTEANRLLFEFPTEIPGAREVKKYATPGAAYTLVHIRQAHDGLPNRDISEQEREYVKKVQSDIHTSLEFLSGRYGRDIQVYFEGLIEPPKKVIEGLKVLIGQDIKDRRESIERVEDDPFLKSVIPEGYLEKMRKEVRLLVEAESYLQKNPCMAFLYPSRREGAVKLAFEKKIEILPLEDPNLIREACQEVLQGKITSKSLDKREDGLLVKIASQESPIAYAVFGAAHAFGGKGSCGMEYSKLLGRRSYWDNLAIWNLEHPDKKFSLIEITPESY